MGDPVGGRPIGAVGHLPPAVSAAPIEPAAVVEAPAGVRAAIAFAAILFLGGIIRWRAGSFLERSIDATASRPLRSIGYGAAAHLALGFAAYYLTFLVGHVEGGARFGPLAGLLLVALTGALGFTVAGSIAIDLVGRRDTGAGLVVGALLAGGVAIVDPRYAALAWLGIVSWGIGGPVRTWIHASAVPNR